MQILGYVNRVKDVEANVDNSAFTLADVESNEVRCPDHDTAQRMWDSEFPIFALFGYCKLQQMG